MADRDHDIVLFGATGFTGGLVADYLASHGAPSPSQGSGSWAIAGRSPERLRAVRERLAATRPALVDLPILQADASDPAAVRRVAESARVVISTVGPYIHYGQELVAACARSGTDYVDLSGEPEFVDLMYVRHHAEAVRTGARLVHSCGFDSVPHDLGTLFTVQQLPEGVPLTVQEYLRVGATFSGGTYHSLIHGLSRMRGSLSAARERRAVEPRPADRRARAIRGRPRHDEVAGGWVLAAPTIDVETVLRSARALPRYGPDFGYGLSIVARRAATLGGIAAGMTTLAALSQIPPARDLLLRLKDPGDGPDAERRARSWFRARFAGDSGAGAGRDSGAPAVVCEVSGGDPGYGETAKMLAESALCLAHDALPETAGQVTPAVAMGDALIARLRAAGISFATVS